MECEKSMASIADAAGVTIQLKPGKHHRLIKGLIEKFVPHFVPGSRVLYAGDTSEKSGYFDKAGLAALGMKVNMLSKMPDVILYYPTMNWLLLVEAVTSHGAINEKRHCELAMLFSRCTAGKVYLTVLPKRTDMARHFADISWETVVWVAEAPKHIILFNGEHFLGPYKT